MAENGNYGYIMLGVFLLLCGIYLLDLAWRRKEIRLILGEKTSSFLDRGGMELLLFLGSFVVFFLLNNHQYVYYNNYSYLSEALLKGHLYVDGMPAYLESVDFGGHTYMHFAPGPSLLCLPFVAVFGVEGFNISWLSMLLGAGNSALFYRVFHNMGIGRGKRERFWCTVLAVFGTTHCFLASIGHSWFLGHVSGWFFLLLGMVFLTRQQGNPGLNLFWAGLFYGFSVTCRMANLPGAVFFFGYILMHREKKQWLNSLLLFCVGAAIFGGMYMAFDYVRYGTIMDQGYNLTHLKDLHRDLYNQLQTLPANEQLAFLKECEKEVGGPLSLDHVAYNLYSIFLLPPEFSSEYPYIIPTMAGVCLSITSPALYFAVRAKYKKNPLCWWILGAMVLCALPFLMNYGNGFAQFGMRYATDFLPYTLLLSAMGLTRKEIKGWKVALILFCVLVNVWGPVYWNCFYLA